MSQRQRRLLAARARRRQRERERRGPTIPPWLWGPVGLLALALAILGGAAAAGYAVYQSYADDLVEPDAILDTQRALGTSKMFDRGGPDGGTLLFEFADPLSGLRNPLPLSAVSQHMIDATVSTEDASFFTNSGINTRGVLRAAYENLGLDLALGLDLSDEEFLAGSGGSSITQQLVKNVLIDPEERVKRTIDRKIKEAILALELTDRFEKEQILEWYFNSIFYGNLAYGIGAASERYFDKSAADLTLAEAALLAGLPQAPATYDPFSNPTAAKARQAQVLDLMATHGFISATEAAAAKRSPLEYATRAFEIVAPHFVFYVRDQVEALCQAGRIPLGDQVQDCDDIVIEGGLRITTTLDLDLQQQAEAILRENVAAFESETGARNAALIAIDPSSGEIVAMVGSRDFFQKDIDGQVNLATALNSPGSSFKPITYISAFIQDPKRWNPATIVWDVPIEFAEFDGTLFAPENFDAIHRGPVTIRSALANSMNIPAFRTADAVGSRHVLTVAHRMGITTMRNPDNFGPAITLGGGDVTLLDLTYAYSVLANNGVMRGQRTTLTVTVPDLPAGFRALDPIVIREIRDSRGTLLYRQETAPSSEPAGHPRVNPLEERRVVPAPQAYQITHILADNPGRSLLYGLNSTLVLDRPAAAKTGTAGDPGRNDLRRDYWTLGYTPQLVTGVWAGNADNSAMTGGTSSRTAGRIWHDFMLAAHEGLPVLQFAAPDGLTTAEVIAPQLRLPPRDARLETPLQDPCARTRSELFVAEGGVPERENGICSEQEVDVRTLLRAGPDTPEAFVREGLYLTPPTTDVVPAVTGHLEAVDLPRAGADGSGEEADANPQIVAWLRAHKVQYVSDALSSEAAVPATIDAPTEGTVIGFGVLLVRGRAAGDELLDWRLAYAPGRDPADDEFVEIVASDAPITGGELGRWDTRGLATGEYTLRLTVEDDYRGEMVVERRVAIAGVEVVASAGSGPG